MVLTDYALNAVALRAMERDLRDCWEGCIPWKEAIEMVGAPTEYRVELRRFWNGLNRRRAH